MDVLWAPWRRNYVVSTAAKNHSNCIFCKAVQDIHSNNYLVYKSKFTIVMLNKYPYNNAHTMVAPIRHVPSLELLSDEELLDLMKTVNIVISAIKLCYNPDGINVGANIGRAAGAGVEGHLHIHIVPRWIGDTNFMAVIARTKVIPESLEETCSRLTECINKVSNSGLKE
ncbi:MAG: HIT domain-containing protein [Ignisphaera sp.]|uniref:HIT domain-containing protein n=1 Tax=Ignisphaera aggregans TaxID=334771 RepID=A0A7C4NL87_9CREN